MAWISPNDKSDYESALCLEIVNELGYDFDPRSEPFQQEGKEVEELVARNYFINCLEVAGKMPEEEIIQKLCSFPSRKSQSYCE